MKKWGNATGKKSYLLVVKKNPQDRTIGDLVNGMAVMVVGEVVVDLGENIDGGTRCHH